MPATFRIDCPGCARPLNFPADALDKPVHCPHCPADFTVPANADGSAGLPRLKPRRGATVPRIVFGPALGLLLLGGTGLFVNGYLAYQFATDPGSDLRYAKILTRNVQAIEATSRPERTDDAWHQLPFAALFGAATALGSNDVLEGAKADELAIAWRAGVVPVNTTSLILSLLTTAGAMCAFTGRGYWLAILGCLAAAVNVNHLCCIPGACLGAWGVLSLARDEGRAHFGIASRK